MEDLMFFPDNSFLRSREVGAISWFQSFRKTEKTVTNRTSSNTDQSRMNVEHRRLL